MIRFGDRSSASHTGTVRPADAEYYDHDYFDILTRRYVRRVRFSTCRIRNVLDTCGVGDFLPRARVLDLGCGMGTFAHEFAARGAMAVGLDFAAAAVQAGVRVARQTATRCVPSFARGQAERLPFADGVFDLVVAADFTEHLNLPLLRRVFSEAFRVLARGGRMVVYTPNPDHIFERLRDYRFLLRPDPSHTSIMCLDELTEELSGAGFVCTRAFHRPSHLPVFSIVERLLAPVPALGRLFRRRLCIRARRPVSSGTGRRAVTGPQPGCGGPEVEVAQSRAGGE